MDILDLDACLKFVSFNGVGLNVENKFKLQNAIEVLLNNSQGDFEELLFWGRVEGIAGDYYICLAFTYSQKYSFPEKKFYWAHSSDFKFKSFGPLNAQHFDKFDSIRSLFSGDP
jgi:hypothetical protein